MPIAPDRFEVARNCRDRYLQDLGLLLRSSGMLGEMSSRAILEGVGRHYDQMVERTSRGGFSEEAHGLTASRITLVGDDELELGIRLDNLTGRLFEGAVTDLWHTYLRFITLLARPDLQKADNPVGPRGISAGLREMFKALGARSLDEQLDLVDRLEELLLSGLPEIYRDLNDFLENASIAAAPASIVGTPDSPQKTSASTDAGQEAIVALQEGLLARSSDLAPALGSSNPDIGIALLSQAALDNLMFRLDNLERTSSSQDDFLTSSSPDLASLLPGLFEDHSAKPQPAARPLTARELGVPSATPEGLAIDSVAMLYEAIQADPKLADALKTMIASLQITLVKQAVKDRSLFTDANHPCRRVIDRLERALFGAPLDIPAQHPLCARLTVITNRLRAAPAGDRSAFEGAARQLDAIIAERHARIDSEAAAYLPLFTWLERRDQALVSIDQLFQGLAIERLPAELFQFIERYWRPILEQTWLKEGPESVAWQTQAAAIRTLLGGFQSGADGEERKAPAGPLAEALLTLNATMDRAKLPAEERTRLLDLCFARQRDALRRSPAPGAAEPVAPNRRPSQRVATGTLKSGTLTLHTLDFTQPHKLAARQSSCQPGDWLELTVAGERQVLRLCRQSPDSGRSLLFNSELALALSIHPQLLELQLRAGEASRLGEPGLFETAAIEALRESRR
jgi:hypothetical protein